MRLEPSCPAMAVLRTLVLASRPLLGASTSAVLETLIECSRIPIVLGGHSPSHCMYWRYGLLWSLVLLVSTYLIVIPQGSVE